MIFENLVYGMKFKIINTFKPDHDIYERIKPKKEDIPFNLAKNIKTGEVITVCGNTEVCIID